MTTLVQHQSSQSYGHLSKYASSENMDKVVQSVTKATKRLSQISTNTTNSNKKRKAQNRIGPWKLGRTLGRGSTGRVRLAKNVETGQLAAVKIVPKSNFKKLENPKYRRDSNSKDNLPYGIEREIIIMKLISHPNIMGLYDVWENKNDLYLILEYIEGGELFDYLIKRGKLQEFEAISYFKQIIHGINYLHQLNICHRDLKPENLLLDFNKNIKIADFGMAALEMREKLLETSCGSPHYASPEIVAGKTYHGAPSDIWSCGIILFALLTGHLPFDDENIRKLLLKVQNGKYIMPPDLSWEAKDLISKMLQVKPDNRISIESILAHPLLTKYPEPPSIGKINSSLDVRFSNMKPIESVDKIDKELLKNLSVLFHNCNEQTIIKKLLSSDQHSEKLFYYLLMKYRNEHASHLNYSEEETDITASESKINIPRSTSIVKTTIVDKSTGEKQTTIKKIPHSKSIQSNRSKSGMRRDKVLSNITNTPSSRNFKASTSFNRKKGRVSNLQKLPSNSSSKSLKKSITPVSTQETQPKLKRKLTGLLDLKSLETTNNEESSIHEDKENRENSISKTTISNIDSKRISNNFKASGTTRTLASILNSNQKNSKVSNSNFKTAIKDKSLLNFELVCQELFDEPKEKKFDKPSAPNDKKELKSTRTGGFDIAKHERKLAEKVRKHNAERENRYKLAEAEFERKRTEEKENERKRQSKLLQEKQQKAIERLNSHIILNKSKNERLRVVTEPPKSSLDPRVNTLMRAKSLATSDTRENVYFNNNKNASIVLQKLGIEFGQSPGAKLSPNLKTSSSRNLSSYLKNDASLSKKSELTIQHFNEKNSRSSLDVTLNKDMLYANNNTSTTTVNKQKNDKNDLESIAEDSVNTQFKEKSAFNNRSLIPNPRFSRFSLGGFLNGNKYDEADMAILNGIASSGTVKKRVSNTSSQIPDTKKGTGLIKNTNSSDILGLGIGVNENENENEKVSNEYNTDYSNFLSVEISESIEEVVNSNTLQNDIISLVQEENDESTLDGDAYDSRKFSFDRNQSNVLLSDISNFEVISSRTADIGKLNTARPSLIDSKDTLLVNSSANDSLATVYKNYENLYEDSYFSSRSNNNDSKENKTKSTFRNKSYFEDSNLNVLDGISLIEDTIDQNETISNLESRISDKSDVSNCKSDYPYSKANTENVSLNKCEENVEIKSVSKQSFARESTRVFSEMALSRLNDKRTTVTSTNNLKSNTLQSNESMYLDRKVSLKPMRAAPKPPGNEEKNGHNKFSRLSMGSHFSKIEPHQPKKKNWFQKLFTFGSQKEFLQTDDKNLKVISANLSSIDLMRIVKNQLELKKIDGTLKRVEIDDEFGLITGEIPSRFLQASKKLIFRIEIIDSIDKSLLNLMKIKGNDKSFQKLIDIVQCIVAQEEESKNQRKSSAYVFSGYQKV